MQIHPSPYQHPVLEWYLPAPDQICEKELREHGRYLRMRDCHQVSVESRIPLYSQENKGNGQRESNLNAEGRWVTGTSGALAYLTPMHILGPLLKGRKAMSINLFSAGSVVSHREGLKVSGEE